jgi:hypothetical protein
MMHNPIAPAGRRESFVFSAGSAATLRSGEMAAIAAISPCLFPAQRPMLPTRDRRNPQRLTAE